MTGPDCGLLNALVMVIVRELSSTIHLSLKEPTEVVIVQTVLFEFVRVSCDG